MKSEKFKLSAYAIESMGYYKKRKSSDDTGYEFESYKNNITELLTSLQKWVNGNNMTVADTITSEAEAESNIKNVYCYSLIEYGGNYLLTTWNETENQANRITTLKINQKVGNAQSGSTSFGDDEKPGFPFYIWFIPNQNMFVAINQDGGSFPLKSMATYVKNFLKYINPDMISRQKVTLFEDTEKIIYDNDPKLKLHVLLKFSPQKRKNLLELVLKNVDRIKKVRSSSRLARNIKNDEDIIDVILRKLHLTKPNNDDSIKLNLSIEYQPDEAQVKNLFLNPDNSEDKIGVEIDGKTYWNKEINSKTELEANEFLEDGKIANCQKLLKYLVDNKGAILKEFD